ncbi:unnamed protein product [Fusarium graminearum]|nr:unnamed protein product [Fusarium graminearum]
MACAETISASLFRRGVWSPVKVLVSYYTQSDSFKKQLTRRCVSLERSDDSRLSDLVRTTVVHIDGLEEKDVALLSYTRGNCLHDLAVDGLLVIGDQVLVEQLLDLVW